MNDDLRFLKESLDDTYFKDLELSKSQKKKILKKATAPTRFSRLRPNFAYITSLVLAASLLLILGLNMIQPDTHSGSKVTIREQQVALIHLQNDIVQLVRDQQLSEGALLAAIKNKEPQAQLELLRTKVINDGETITARLKKMSIPSQLSANQTEINQSLIALSKAYEQKNSYYKELDVTDVSSISVYNMPIEQFALFEETIGKVYKNLGLLTPSFQILLYFLRGE